VRGLHELPEPQSGYRPHWDAVADGRREFAGRVINGPWIGHEVLVLVWGEGSLDRTYQPADFMYSADYWLVDKEAAGFGEGEVDANVVTLEELYEFIDDEAIHWYPPLQSLKRVGLLFGTDGETIPT
jgi:hypothetical protein